MGIISSLLSVSAAPDVGLEPWFVKRADAISRAVGRVSIDGAGFGTGFLIAPATMLTCAHVLPDAATAARSSLVLDYQREEDGSFGPTTTVRFRPDALFVADLALDFAVVATEDVSGDRPAIPLVGNGDYAPGERVSLFHHPMAGPLRMSLRAGGIVAANENYLFHDANTQPGSAGGPLLDENLRLIGLHHAFGRRRTAGADVERPVNEAVRASAILAAVAKSIPQLFKSPDASGKGNNVPPPAGRKAAASRPISPAAAPAAAAAAVPASSASTEIAEAGAAQERNSVFISYARDDQGKHRWRERLRTFLSAFKAELDVWDDSRIETGAEWRSEIDIALKRARVAVLLVGPSFLGSDFINKNELPPLLNAAADQGVTILPLITNHCSYEKTELGRHQAFNEPNKPLEALSRPAQNGWLRKFADKIDDAFRSSKA